MNETKKEFKWFWAWNDEAEEEWLGEQARQGWHLKAPGTFGFYTFEKGESRDVVYRMDINWGNKDMDDYLQVFADAGWGYVGAMGSWQYFRKERVPGEGMEIFTDNTSKIKKYERVLMFLAALLPVYLFVLYKPSTDMNPEGFWGVLLFGATIFGVALMFLYIYAMIRIMLRINQLKK